MEKGRSVVLPHAAQKPNHTDHLVGNPERQENVTRTCYHCLLLLTVRSILLLQTFSFFKKQKLKRYSNATTTKRNLSIQSIESTARRRRCCCCRCFYRQLCCRALRRRSALCFRPFPLQLDMFSAVVPQLLLCFERGLNRRVLRRQPFFHAST